MFSVLAASFFLPFLPMAAVQIILRANLIYDTVNIALPLGQRGTRRFSPRPRRWGSLCLCGRLRCWKIGPMSPLGSDIATFGADVFHRVPGRAGRFLPCAGSGASGRIHRAVLQAGCVHRIHVDADTGDVPKPSGRPACRLFVQSRASVAVVPASLAGVALASGIAFAVFGEAIGLEPLPAVYFAWLFAMTGGYLALVAPRQ